MPGWQLFIFFVGCSGSEKDFCWHSPAMLKYLHQAEVHQLSAACRCMALSLAAHNIRVNGIGPGSIMTDVLTAVASDKSAMNRWVHHRACWHILALQADINQLLATWSAFVYALPVSAVAPDLRKPLQSSFDRSMKHCLSTKLLELCTFTSPGMALDHEEVRIHGHSEACQHFLL